MGFTEILTLILVVAKLTGHLAWSWWWVLSPMIVVYSILLIVMTLAGYVAYRNV